MRSPTLRERVKQVLKATGLSPWVSRAKYVGRIGFNPQFRKLESANWREYFEWRRRYAAVLQPTLYPRSAGLPRALIVTKGTLKGAQVELGLIKGIELAGFVPVVLTDQTLEKHYRLAGVTEFVRWEDAAGPSDVDVESIAAGAACIEDVMGFEYGGARVGKFALSTTFRSLRVGRLDFTDAATRRALAGHLAGGVTRAAAARRILDRVKPHCALFMGNRYTGQGELMDVCVERGVDVLTWFDAHRSSALMLKRYRMANRDRHHGSISDQSWSSLLAMPWTEERRAELKRELHDNYAAGDWYSRGGTQVNKRIVPTSDLRAQLRLDPGKKTAVIFPHIVWDATLFWGTDLFNNYEDWLIETVRAACDNPRVNWIIKIHPAHVAKSAMERFDGEPAEIAAIRRRIGALPPHVVLIRPDTAVNTYSLFAIMDYCLTVRGTIGIEAASLGVRVLTAGTGRYDHRGFTIDSQTRAEYLARLAAIEAMAPMSPAERELAERFAYGAFILRPFTLHSIAIAHDKDVEATMRIGVTARSSDELRRAPDLNAFAAWVADGQQEDFLADGPLALDRSA